MFLHLQDARFTVRETQGLPKFKKAGTRMGRLTTHVLDTALGRPGAGIEFALYRMSASGGREKLGEFVTNDDGRCDRPLLEGASFTAGSYELVFAAGAYFDRAGLTLPEPKFLDQVTIRFGIASAEQHYHVPLLLSPYAYSTYRGS
jgi:5-hydroxyisourate hydrolase